MFRRVLKTQLGALLIVVLAAAMLSLVAGGCGDDEEEGPSPGGKIVLADSNWDSAQLQNRIVMFILEHGYGYETDAILGDVPVLWQGVRTGDIDIMMEAWLPNQQDLYDAATEEGSVVPVGKSLDDNWQSMFVVPTYVVEGDTDRGIEPMAPDLKSYEDVREYKDLFTDVESGGKAVLWTCIPGWKCEEINEQKLEVYGLEDVVELRNPGSAATLFASLEGAYAKGEAWLGYMWGPTKIAAELDLTILEEPDCPEGQGPETGCAYPTAEIKIVAHNSLKERAPEVIEFLEKWDFKAATQVAAETYMTENEASIDETAIWFLKNQGEAWEQWVPASVAEKVNAALETT
jgi:glycine betaine/proline transport system substrate-binding protein